MAPSSDKARGLLDTAIDWLYIAWARAAAWDEAQKKKMEGPSGMAKVFLFAGVMTGAMLVVFGTGKRLWTRKLGEYGTVQLQSRFSWNRGARAPIFLCTRAWPSAPGMRRGGRRSGVN